MNVIVSETALTFVNDKLMCGVVMSDKDGKEYPLGLGEPTPALLHGLFALFKVTTWEQVRGSYCMIQLEEDGSVAVIQDILGAHQPVYLKSNPASNSDEENAPVVNETPPN